MLLCQTGYGQHCENSNKLHRNETYTKLFIRLNKDSHLQLRKDIVKYSPITRQLGKHIPAKRTRATEGRSLLGNVPVNTPP
jgi:hypothetical protein